MRPERVISPSPADEGDSEPRKGIFKRIWADIMEDDIMGQAAKVAFFAFLSFPPAILVLFGLTGFFASDAAAEWIAQQLQAALPEAASAMIDDFVSQVVHEEAPGPLSIGIVIALWAASNVFMALGDGLNLAYGIKDRRSWVKRRLIAIGVLLSAAVLLLAGSALLLAGPYLAGAVNLWGIANFAWLVLQWPLAFLLVVGAFFIVYYVLPNRDQSFSRAILFKSATIAALGWILATTGFRLYVSNLASYSETYGFLGAVIVFLLWLWVTGIVVLVGGELNSEWEAGQRA